MVNQDRYEGDQTVGLDSGGVTLIVKRDDYISYPHVLSEGEFLFIRFLESGQPIGTARDISQELEGSSFKFVDKVQGFVAQSILVDFYF